MATADYELVLMLDPRSGEDERNKIAADAKAKLESAGTLGAEAEWGMRKLAYEIEQRNEADYRYYRFNGGKDLLDDVSHSLRITDAVLRFRIFRADPETPMTVPPDVDEVMREREDDRGRGRGGRREGRGGPRRPREDSEQGEDGEGGSGQAPAPAESAAQPAETPSDA